MPQQPVYYATYALLSWHGRNEVGKTYRVPLEVHHVLNLAESANTVHTERMRMASLGRKHDCRMVRQAVSVYKFRSDVTKTGDLYLDL